MSWLEQEHVIVYDQEHAFVDVVGGVSDDYDDDSDDSSASAEGLRPGARRLEVRPSGGSGAGIASEFLPHAVLEVPVITPLVVGLHRRVEVCDDGHSSSLVI